MNPKTCVRRPGDPSGSAGAIGETGITSEAPSGPNSSDGRIGVPLMLLCELVVLGTDPLPHGSESLGPFGGDEGSGAGVPASEPHGPRDAVRVRQQHASHDGRVDRSRAPGRVALGVAVPRLLMERQAVDLQPDDHPGQLQVERA